MYNLKIKYYNNGTMQVIHFDNPVCYEKKKVKAQFSEVFEEEEQFEIDISEPSESADNNELNIKRALRRSKAKIIDYCRNNNWELFVTFTLSKEKVDRYNFDEASKKLRKWLNNQIYRYFPEGKYVIIPEQHEDGAWHFHGLLSGFNFDLQRAFNPHTGKLLKDNKKRQIYNIKAFSIGWTTVTKVDDTKKVTTYILKYVTKELISKLPGKQKYYISKSCELPFEAKYLIKDGFVGSTIKQIMESNAAHITFQKEVVVDTIEYKNTITYYEMDGNEGVLLE